MKRTDSVLPAILMTFAVLISFSGCNKDDNPPTPADYLEISFPGMEYQHGLYYHLDHDARAIELLTDEPVDTSGIRDKISLSDKNGNLDANYTLVISGKLIMLKFNKGFHLERGWKYTLKVSHSLQSVSGSRLPAPATFDIRTMAGHIFKAQSTKSTRDAIVSISDIHMGDGRANDNGYSWFGQNKAALEAFLDTVSSHSNVRTLTILGDLFDEWVVPCEVSPFDTAAEITSSAQYFKAIADAPTNAGIIQRLQNLAGKSGPELVYVPGNHDMLITQDILSELIPGITWAGDVSGLGIYNPVGTIVMEHGHRYDFFNAPQPLVNDGHMLPPGYFISRLFASGMVYGNQGTLKQTLVQEDSFEFNTAWTIAFLYVLHQFDMDVPPLDSARIRMGGIDDYVNAFSFDQVQNMYASDIEDLWPQTQEVNNVPVPISVFSAIWNGHFLTSAVTEEYISQSPGMAEYNVITFGHSHDPMLKVYPDGSDYSQVYANTGSWVDEDQCENPVRTFVVIVPGAWSGSEIDCVQLYQFNAATSPDGSPAGYSATLLAEENIEPDH